MTPKPISPADPTPIRVVILTLDHHAAGAVREAEGDLRRDLPGLRLSLHAAADWGDHPEKLAAAKAAIAGADIIFANMMFIEDHIQAVLPDMQARREACDAMVVIMSAGEIIKLTRLGAFRMDQPQKGPIALLKKLRGAKSNNASSGAGQMKMLRQLPKILRFIPGKAQDVRAYFLVMQYWLTGSRENLANLVRFLIERYADGPRRALRVLVKSAPPVEHPDVGLYHPDLPAKITTRLEALPHPPRPRGTIGLIVLRSYLLAKDSAHYDGVIAALEAQGLAVIPAFAQGLDARPAIERYFIKDGKPIIDAMISLTGFSLVGGPAYNDQAGAVEMLKRLDLPYVAAHPLEFQSLNAWAKQERGLTPLEATMMIAIPELDGATGPIVYGGRGDGQGAPCAGCARACVFPADGDAPQMRVCAERAAQLADRIGKWVDLRRRPRPQRKLAIVLFNFPPNAGAAGTAAFLGVFESLHATLSRLKAEGYQVEVPASIDALRARLLEGNRAQFGAETAIAARISSDKHIESEPYLREIEAQWGPSPGQSQSLGSSILIAGAHFGAVFVGFQPPFGYEGDPMRLLFERNFTPTHAFSAFYRYIREDFGADCVLHFGTHGALEFMPGKQNGQGARCWPDRLIGNLPNFYLYAANNPSEGAIAKRRIGATLLSYLTPPIAQAGLYRGLSELKSSIDRWRGADPDAVSERADLAALIQAQAASLDFAAAAPAWDGIGETQIIELQQKIREVEESLIPTGLHVLGRPMQEQARAQTLLAIAKARGAYWLTPEALGAMLDGASPAAVAARCVTAGEAPDAALIADLSNINQQLMQDHELPALIHALDGGFVAPSPSGDLIRSPDILPTGRNLHGFDPFRLPSAFAIADGARQADRLLAKHRAEGGNLPQTVAIVLWGTDNLKSEGAPIAQALALMGAQPRFDAYGRLCGAKLIPLAELGRPRIDVVATLSGIFRDLLPLQTQMLAEAAYLCASADEPLDQNFIRAHALAVQEAQGVDLETAALRVFSNAEGAYGANVNQLIDSGAWGAEDELADAFEARKSFAYGRSGKPIRQQKVMQATLKTVDLAYQNLDSVELGVTTIDHYVDTLGGISRAVARAKGVAAPVYIGDQTQGEGQVRTINEQVALETRARTLNPRWYEALLAHGYEGVRQIEAQVTNTMGWSATTGQVEPWVYQRISETFVLDAEMRQRLANLNPAASARMAQRLLEAHDRDYWRPDADTLAALRAAGDEFDDRLEGLSPAAAYPAYATPAE
ncbi:MAG TPA: magnesium chelatase subunit H [Hyphomonadaceae bacterium]|nr:magnesium chelatase subunit H [Hyphomonadaceae bacterium]